MVLQPAIPRLDPHPSPKMDIPHCTLYKRLIERTDPLGSGSRLKESRGTDTKVPWALGMVPVGVPRRHQVLSEVVAP